MISNREIARVVHEVERAIVVREHKDEVAATPKGKKPPELIPAPRWEECPPSYQESRTQQVHNYKESGGGFTDPDALDESVYAAIVDALK